MILTVAAFEQCVRLLFVDEGVRHLTMDSAVASPHDDEVRGMLEVLDVYDVREVLVGLESLAVRGLAEGDCRIAITALPEAAIPVLIAEHDRLQVV